MFKVTASTPTRVDLAGGTLDILPLHHLLEAKATVNLAVSLNAAVEIRPAVDGVFTIVSEDQDQSVSGRLADVLAARQLPLFSFLLGALWNPSLPALQIRARAKSPQGAGLGGSSSLGIAVAAALMAARHELNGESALGGQGLVQLVQDVETRLIHAPTGCQDHWGAVNGGFTIIHYPPGGCRVSQLPVATVEGIGDGLILCFSGRSRASASNNWQIFRRAFEGDQEVLEILNQIGRTSEELATCVKEGDRLGLFEASKREWSLRKRLWSDIETTETRAIETAARKAGASFARVCGAGGGGVMAIFCPDADQSVVKEKLVAAGGTILDGNATDNGLKVAISRD